MRGYDIRKAEDHSGVDFFTQAMLHLQFAQNRHILGETLFIYAGATSDFTLYPGGESDMTTCNPVPEKLANIAFPFGEGARKLDAGVEETMIYRPDLNTDPGVSNLSLGRPETGH